MSKVSLGKYYHILTEPEKRCLLCIAKDDLKMDVTLGSLPFVCVDELIRGLWDLPSNETTLCNKSPGADHAVILKKLSGQWKA